jgi:hypothetical protein
MAINSNFYVAQNNATLDIGYRDGNSTQLIKTWLWSVDGTLTLPTAGRINFDYLSISSDANVSAFYAPSGNVQLAAGIGNAQIVASSLSDSKIWNFGTGGNLALPAGGVLLVSGGITAGPTISSPAPYLSGFGSINSQTMTASGNISGNYFVGNGALLTGITAGSNYGNANVAAYLTTYGGPVNANVITGTANATINGLVVNASATIGTTLGVTGNITAGNIITNQFGNSVGTTATYTANVTAGNLITSGTSGNITGANVISATTFVGNGSQLTGVATQVTSSWSLAAGANSVNINIATPGTFSIWVNGNIPNGIVTYTATVVITNSNVPVVGSQYGWFYEAGNALVLTSIPTQVVGNVGTISNASPVVSNAYVFSFGINNNSGTTQVVNWGYTKL